MNAKDLCKGIAVLIDDQINTNGTTICKIKDSLLNACVPVVVYNDIPDNRVVKSLSNASFIAIDWEFLDTNRAGSDATLEGIEDLETRVSAPRALNETVEARRNNFIKKVIDSLFVPTFIFTHLDSTRIQEELSTLGVWNEDRPNRLFIKSKDEVADSRALFKTISDWLKVTPSAYCLKQWDKSITTTKNRMFIELFGRSPEWTKVLWSLLTTNGDDVQKQFGEFISRSILNRVDEFSFQSDIFRTDATPDNDALQQVFEGERYIKYSEPNNAKAHTGDLYKIDGEYYLNVRAQCDLLRRSDADVTVYLIHGQVANMQDISTESMHFTKEKEFFLNTERCHALDAIKSICENDADLAQLNTSIEEKMDKPIYRLGSIIGRNYEVYVSCLDGQKVIKFNLEIKICEDFSKNKGCRIGRLLSPYIDYIQQAFAYHIVRQGTMPSPQELFRG